MPMYILEDKKTGDRTQIICTYEEREEYIRKLNEETGKDYQPIIDKTNVTRGFSWGRKGHW